MGKRMDKKTDNLLKNDEDNSKGGFFKRFVLSLLVIMILAAATVAGYGYYTLNKITRSDVTAKKVDISKPVNILLLGVDAGDYKNHSIKNPNRSDTMMVVRFNPKNNNVYILSMPRDTKVILKGHVEKLNAAHSMGGTAYTISTVEKLLGIDINYYGEINYEGFRECIDAIGGVDITIPRDMDYDAWKINIHFKKGEVVHMDGKKAEEYVRWRKNNDGSGYATGDLGRIAAQQEFMVKVFEKIKTPTGLIRIPRLISTISKYLKTNMTSDVILEYALRARNIKPDLIQRETLPGEAKYIGGISYYVWDKDTTNKFVGYFKGMDEVEAARTVSSEVNLDKEEVSDTSEDVKQGSEPSTFNKPIDTETVKSVSRNNIDVVILNSTGKAGLAAAYKTKLEKLGYKVINTDNYLYKKYDYTIINDYTKLDYGNTIYKDLKLGRVIKKSKAKPMASLVIILGSDSIK